MKVLEVLISGSDEQNSRHFYIDTVYTWKLSWHPIRLIHFRPQALMVVTWWIRLLHFPWLHTVHIISAMAIFLKNAQTKFKLWILFAPFMQVCYVKHYNNFQNVVDMKQAGTLFTKFSCYLQVSIHNSVVVTVDVVNSSC